MAQVGTYTISVERDELNTILAALRYYQDGGMGEPGSRPNWLQEIACPDDDTTSLDDSAIDDLCERINCAPEDDAPSGSQDLDQEIAWTADGDPVELR